jgi:hypothetical protein
VGTTYLEALRVCVCVCVATRMVIEEGEVKEDAKAEREDEEKRGITRGGCTGARGGKKSRWINRGWRGAPRLYNVCVFMFVCVRCKGRGGGRGEGG